MSFEIDHKYFIWRLLNNVPQLNYANFKICMVEQKRKNFSKLQHKGHTTLRIAEVKHSLMHSGEQLTLSSFYVFCFPKKDAIT